MLSASIKISNIDYENTFQHIFPTVSERIRSWNSKNMIVRLFQQMGDAALPILISMMYRTPEDTKRELLVRGLNAYAPVLRDKLNVEFMKDEWGQYFKIGSIFIDQQDGLLLNIGQIKVDYHALLNNDQISGVINEQLGVFSLLAKTAASMVTVFVPNTMEKKGLDLLWREENKARLMDLIRSALFNHGIRIELDEIQLVQDKNISENVIESKQPLVLTEKMEDDIICALAYYLRDNVSNSLQHG